MAENSVKHFNSVEVEGYLKENGLTKTTSADGVEVISGTLTIALSGEEDYRMRFYAAKYAKSDKAHAKVLNTYTRLETLLPSMTTSIATLLQGNPNMSFEEAKGGATPMWMRGSFDVYDRKEENGNIVTSVSTRGMSAGIKTPSSQNPFVLKALFDVEGALESKAMETTNGEETGRMLVTIAVPDYYSEVIYPIDFVVENQGSKDTFAQYEIGQSGRYVGSLRNSRKVVKTASSGMSFSDGSVDEGTTTVFVNERVIEKLTYPFDEAIPNFISAETLAKFKANRAQKLNDLEITPKKGSNTSPTDNMFPNVNSSRPTMPTAAAQGPYKGFVL